MTDLMRCPDCRSAWVGSPPILYHEHDCPRGGEAQAGTALPGAGVMISVTNIAGHADCTHCNYTTAGTEVEDDAIDHTKRTGHTTVIKLRTVETITPA